MGSRRWLGLGGLALAAAGFAPMAVAQPMVTAAAPTPSAAELGIVRVRIDPGVGDQDARIRTLLDAHPFARIAEPADYLLTTNPDFPLDLAAIDLTQPPERWRRTDPNDYNEPLKPRRFVIGNLEAEDTAARLAALLVSAARVRSLLDRSFADLQGVEVCLLASDQAAAAGPCTPPGIGAAINFGGGNVLMRVRNNSQSERFFTLVAADGSLAMRLMGEKDDPPLGRLAPGQSIDVLPMAAAFCQPDDPRVMLLVSARPFAIDRFAQPALNDLPPWCGAGDAKPPSAAQLGPLALNDDLAVRSVRVLIDEEPRPAMGGGSDVTARMAVWMAQFYSVIPYTPAEIAADDKLPEEETKFLALRSYEERQHRCGAALIGPNLVLTAAHCLAKDQFAGDGLAKVLKQRRIRLGSRKIGQGGQSFAIAGVAVHANYDPKRQNHDIALLLLKPDRGSGSALPPPIAVADKPLPGGVDALGFGWGLTGAVTPNGNIMMRMDARMQDNAEVLQYGEMRSVSLNECKRKFTGTVAAGMVCMYSKAALAGGQSAEGVFTCRGDSGGPLVRKVGGRDVLVGVVSWSKGCGFKDYPSVFTDAGSYAAWIAAARAELKPGAAIRPKDPARPR